MVPRTLLWIAALLLAAGVIAATAQEGSNLTARELFYGMSSSKKPAPGEDSRNPKGSVSAKSKAVTPASASRRSPATGNTQKRTDEVAVAPVAKANPPAPGTAVSALGLRYSVLRGIGTDQFVETDSNTTFHSGDGIRVSIESNDEAYLYIVNKGSSGTWNVLFPSPDINGGINRLQAHQRIEVPAKGQFTFVDEPGEERLYVVLSRPPEADLERLISSLARHNQQEDVAANSGGDDFLGKIRRAVERDLIFEKSSGDKAGAQEQANYVVNVNESGSGRVVADLTLQHK